MWIVLALLLGLGAVQVFHLAPGSGMNAHVSTPPVVIEHNVDSGQ